METVKFIAIAYFALFAGGTAPGLINMYIAKITISKDKKNGIYAAWGAFTANIIQAVVCILLTKFLTKHFSLPGNMLKIGVFVFGGLMLYFLIVTIRNKPIKQEIKKKDSGRSFVKGFLMTCLNVLLIPYFIFIGTQLNITVDNAFSFWYIALFAISAGLGTFSILYLYVIMALHLQKRTNLIVKYANTFMTILMFILFTITLMRLYYV